MKPIFNFLFIFVVISISYVEADVDYRCSLPVNGKVGTFYCLASTPRYGYEASTDECVLFNYGGCGGNENNFDTKEDCERACRGGS